MYKTLIFLKKTDEEQVLNHFYDYTIKYISALTKEEVKVGKVESSLLLPEKYMLYCEIGAGSKEEMDRMLNTREGKDFQKDLMQFHEFITIINVDYSI